MQMSRPESGRPLWEARAGWNGVEREGGSLEEIDDRALVRYSLGLECGGSWNGVRRLSRRDGRPMGWFRTGAEPSPQSAARGSSGAKTWAGTAAGRRERLRTTYAWVLLQNPVRVSRSTPGALVGEGREAWRPNVPGPRPQGVRGTSGRAFGGASPDHGPESRVRAGRREWMIGGGPYSG